MNLPWDGTNQLPKAGFDWIALKVIFQGQKGLILPLLSNLDTYCPFIPNLFCNFSLFWHEASPGSWQRSVKRRISLNHSKGHCQGQKCQVWLIFTHLTILISSIEVLPKCIASCSFSEVILVLFSNFNGVFFKVRKVQFGPLLSIGLYLGQYLRTGACCEQCLYEAHIQSHIWSFSWPCDFWPWITLKGQIKVTDLSRGCVS